MLGASSNAATEPKARIPDAAADAFMRHGFADTTIDDIGHAVRHQGCLRLGQGPPDDEVTRRCCDRRVDRS
jgi:hypothetical protein